ncbi:MAG: hypothetical protein FWD92_06760 [Methanomassiliicoccaceae archaeon]|nr:hypothetical protein [Methanomassiliicoccaceae archaeon]
MIPSFPEISGDWLKRAKRRYAASFMGGEYDRMPVDPMMLSHATVACGYSIRDFYERPELGAHCLAYAQEMYDLLPVTKYYFAHPWLPELGADLKFMDKTAPVPIDTVVKCAEDVDKLHIPDIKEIENGYTYTRLTGASRYIKEKLPEMFVPLAYCPEPVGSAAELCGVEEFLIWTETERELVKKMIDVYVETAITGAEALAKAYGSALISTGSVLENSDTMSPETIKDISPPALEKLVKGSLMKGAGPQVFYHFCGNRSLDYELYVNEIVITPFTIMQMGYFEREPFPASIMKERFGSRATIMPSVDTKLFVLPDQKRIYEQAKQQVINGRDSKMGCILGTCCEVPPNSHPANIRALVKAAEDFGRYGSW